MPPSPSESRTALRRMCRGWRMSELVEQSSSGGVCLGCRAPIPSDALHCGDCARAYKPPPPREQPRPVSAKEPPRLSLVLPGPRKCADCRALTDGRKFCGACIERRIAARDAAKLREARMIALAGVPMAWTDNTETYLRAVKSPKMRAIGERYALTNGSLLTTAPTGAGKTASAARALRRLIRAAKLGDAVCHVLWTNGSELARARRRHKLGEGDAPVIVDAKRAPLLVIDELRLHADDEAVMDVVDARYLAGFVTIVTTGATLDELVSHYGAACVRRFSGPVGAVVSGWST